MDYTNFLRTYIGSAIREVGRYRFYNGARAYVNDIEFPDLGDLHASDGKMDAMPAFEPNINAPIETYERFSEMVSKMNPDLRLAFPYADDLRRIFFELSRELGADDEKMSNMAALAAKSNAEILMKAGVISDGD